jgi:hypothetical protein
VRPGPRDGFRWNRTTILYAFDLWHRRHLRPPTLDEWRYARDDHPSAMTVQRVFGSWNRGIRSAGFVTRLPGERRAASLRHTPTPSDQALRWPRERILDVMRAWHTTHGAPPYMREWRRASTNNPTAETVRRVFGSWNAAVAEAGFAPRPQWIVDRPRCEETGRWLPEAA